MMKITQIQQAMMTKQILVYIEYYYSISIRDEVCAKMGLKEGDGITCTELIQRGNAVYRRISKRNYIFLYKDAMTKIISWFNQYVNVLDAKITEYKHDPYRGFSYIYPLPRYSKNITLFIKDTDTAIINLEVTPVRLTNGLHYVVPVDKIGRAQLKTKNSGDGWVALYHKYPRESFTWLKSDPQITYPEKGAARNSERKFNYFKNTSPEIYTSVNFFDYVQAQIDKKLAGSSPLVVTTNPFRLLGKGNEE